jgi:hypothetical protein
MIEYSFVPSFFRKSVDTYIHSLIFAPIVKKYYIVIRWVYDGVSWICLSNSVILVIVLVIVLSIISVIDYYSTFTTVRNSFQTTQ